MKETATTTTITTKTWVFDEADVINILLEKVGIPMVGDGTYEVSWDVDVSQAGIRSIVINKTKSSTS